MTDVRMMCHSQTNSMEAQDLKCLRERTDELVFWLRLFKVYVRAYSPDRLTELFRIQRALAKIQARFDIMQHQ